jgi:hypothetical protein
MNETGKNISDWVSFLAYLNLFEIKNFIVVVNETGKKYILIVRADMLMGRGPLIMGYFDNLDDKFLNKY